ncbi:putative protein phosphatase 2C T23F11.1 [Diplonema papillatum]|nr:putative protein phosphatase 2C T23F11.1 [Diplonema papillatum]|eukprot:gene6187-9473_t
MAASDANINYLRAHTLHKVVEEMVSELVQRRPKDPREGMLAVLRRWNTGGGKEDTARGPASGQKRGSLPQFHSLVITEDPDGGRPAAGTDGLKRGRSSFCTHRKSDLDVPQYLLSRSFSQGNVKRKADDLQPPTLIRRVSVRKETSQAPPGDPGPPLEADEDLDSPRLPCCGCTEADLLRHVSPRVVGAGPVDYEADPQLAFHTAFYECAVCRRRPAARLSLHDLTPLCREHSDERARADEKSQVWVNYDLAIYEKAVHCAKCGEMSFENVDALDEFLAHLFSGKGAYVADPVLDTEVDELTSELAEAVAVSMQGWRADQEDACMLLEAEGKRAVVAGVFDGHGGAGCSSWLNGNLARHLPLALFSDAPAAGELVPAVLDSFVAADAALRAADATEFSVVGSTCCLALVFPRDVFCFNVGDSRAILVSKTGGVTELSTDHNLTDPEERDRVTAAGYSIVRDRIEGMLSVPRAFGDFDFKQCGGKSEAEQAVSVVPTAVHVERTPDDLFILIACDGVWDGYENEGAAAAVMASFEAGKSDADALKDLLLSNVAAELSEGAVGTDNETAILIRLK